MRHLLLIAALIYGVAHSQEPQKPKAAEQKATTEQRGTEKSPLFIKTPSPTTQAERDHEAYEKHQKPWNETALAYATIALSFITLALAIFTAFLWRSTSRLVDDAKDTSRRQLRAYLMISRAEIYIDGAPGSSKRVRISAKNFGQTPAYSVRYWLSMCSKKFPTRVFERDRLSNDVGAGVIAPGDTFATHATIPPLNNGNAIHDGTYAFYVYGVFLYKDAFGYDWVTPFRYMQIGPGWTDEKEMHICAEGNDAQ